MKRLVVCATTSVFIGGALFVRLLNKVAEAIDDAHEEAWKNLPEDFKVV